MSSASATPLPVAVECPMVARVPAATKPAIEGTPVSAPGFG
jgi:hypothetical protein